MQDVGLGLVESTFIDGGPFYRTLGINSRRPDR